jgi:ribulose-5-phosphate 4-epimerase/fuculose-1-phosphate aldolase
LTEAPEIDGLAAAIAMSCRILGLTGCVREVTGHISARVTGTEEMLIRCRRPDDPGVAYSTPGDVRQVRLDGTGLEAAGFSKPGVMGSFSIPGEFSIHSEIYRARPDVMAVAHGHPKFSLLCGILGIPLTPVLGAYDPAALDLLVSGVPTFERSTLITTPALGVELAEVLAESDACLMRGHGIVAVGSDVYEATVRAIRLETMCEIAFLSHTTGRTPTTLPQEEIDELVGFVRGVSGSASLARAMWDHYRHTLSLTGQAI